ncbi:DUF6686 family protein [Pedobacter antarcticus]|uniref:DUF6686 family protein n=1 Tax=Pedobacter antarcticus TaxID=34086 RepID=UPI001FD5F4C1|nr:DUF6686 family protein [Pedobacter antarcticus]
MCKTIVLSTQEDSAVSHCPSCHVIYVWHKNLMLNFSEQDFLSFKSMLDEYRYCESGMPFPDQRERILLHTPHEDISFAFTQEELLQLLKLLDEALFMKEVYTLMRTEPGFR